FIAGALSAAALLDSPKVRRLAYKLYREMDFWAMMTDGGTKPNSRTLTMGWEPETGYLIPRWDSYAEHLLLLILGLGHPEHPLPPETWTEFTRAKDSSGLLGGNLPLFVHQYSQLFIDFRKMSHSKEDIFRNSVAAHRLHRDLARANGGISYTYQAGFWGLSAGDSLNGYQAFSPEYSDGTVCPGCAGASAMFLGDSVVEEMQSWAEGPFGNALWGKYGFGDGLNLDHNWVGEDAIGITVGALYLSLANMGDGDHPFNGLFSNIPEVAQGMARARQALNQ
ncbi:MAG: glucoamylase family protein, partial [Verrucomicrobiales bacterium]